MTARLPRPGGITPAGPGTALLGLFLGAIVILPLAAVVAKSGEGGFAALFDAIGERQAIAALKLTLTAAAIVALINSVTGTIIAWVLVRDEFPGKPVVNALIDLPFALPTIVAGLTLLALYGPDSPLGLNLAFTMTGVVTALLFVTLPFVVRSVQPVLLEIDRDMEEAAASLGASRSRIFRSIVFPNLLPAICAGAGLAFARAVGEFGAVVLIAGNMPFKTELASVYIFGQIESNSVQAAAAVSVALLVISLLVLALIAAAGRWGAVHDE